jgi:hypothetical protein
MRHLTRITVTVSAAGWLALTVVLHAQKPLFEAGTQIPIGRGSGPLTLIDTNGDTHLDLVVGRFQRGPEVRLGNGRGQFSPAPGGPLNLGVELSSMVLGDVTADGVPDLVATHKDSVNEYVQVFPGEGNGRFRRNKRHKANDSFEFYKPAIRLADVDANGAIDIITSNGRRNTIEVLLGNGRGGFTAAHKASLTPGSSFWTFGVGDIDADGFVDLVTTFDPSGAASARVEIRRGLGNGRFEEPSSGISVRPGARIAAVADLNADARPDVVVSHVDTGWMSILLNDGRGSLTPAPQSPRDLGLQPFGVVVTDINHDRRADIVATTVNSQARPFESKVVVLLGDGFTATGSPLPVGPGAYSLAVGDIDEDGKLDAVTSSFEGDSISVLLGRQ